MVLTLSLHDSRRADVLVAQELRTTPQVPLHQYHDGFGSTCTRLVSPAGALTVFSNAVVEDTGWTDEVVPAAQQVRCTSCRTKRCCTLLGSRYCETDKLVDKAWSRFGHTPTGWASVQEICDYVHHNVQFGYEYADATKGAWGALEEGRGVRRDFAHSAIALCRCMNIPARYCTGFLGDMAVPATGAPVITGSWRGSAARRDQRVAPSAFAAGSKAVRGPDQRIDVLRLERRMS